MKRKSAVQIRCTVCQVNSATDSSVCNSCRQTVAAESQANTESFNRANLDATLQDTLGLSAHRFNELLARADDALAATQLRDTLSANAYQALMQTGTQTDDALAATQLRDTLSADAYQALMQTGTQTDDALAKQAVQFATPTERKETRFVANAERTERVAGFLPAHLYRQIVAQEQPEPQPEPPVSQEPSAPAVAVRPKRSRRKFLAALHLVVDILLVVLVVLAGLGVYTQYVQTQQTRAAAQGRLTLANQEALTAQEETQAQQLATQEEFNQAQQQATNLVQTFHKTVSSWDQSHLYRDSYDSHRYPLASGYEQAGVGAFIDKDLAEAHTTAEYQSVVSATQNELFNLQMLEADYQDHTPFNQAHASDLHMLQRYQLSQGTVMVVSLVEQIMRVYQQGKLVRAFHITTGRVERPSLPGVWSVLDRQSPTIFESGDPPGSPYWFPNTPINYAILYHLGGFFVHDAPWRGTFGPGSQFPHRDSSGNTSYNFDGSHGCINLSEADAAWVYQHTTWKSSLVIY